MSRENLSFGCPIRSDTNKDDVKRLEISNLESRRTYHVVKRKALISCAITTQVICAFDFAYAKSRFSHDVAQMEVYKGFDKKAYTYPHMTEK